MTFAHIADTHLGYRQYNLAEREQDFYEAFHEAVEKIIDSKAEVVLHSGDLFNEAKPSIRAMLEVKKGIKALQDNGIKVVMIAGNHDFTLHREAIPPHKLYDNVVLLTKKQPGFVYGDFYIAGINYMPLSYKSVLKEDLKKVDKEAEKHEKRILMLHQSVDKYLPLASELSIAELPKNFDYFAFGHIHDRIVDTFDNKVLCYPGSTEIWRIDEVDNFNKHGKGFLLFDDDFNVKKINLSSIRRFIRAEINEENKKESFEYVLKEVDEISKNSKLPVAEIRIDESIFPEMQAKVRREFSDKTLYISFRKLRRIEQERKEIKQSFGIAEILKEMMHGYGEAEISFASDLLALLSANEIEKARKLVEDFYTSKKKEEGIKKASDLTAWL